MAFTCDIYLTSIDLEQFHSFSLSFIDIEIFEEKSLILKNRTPLIFSLSVLLYDLIEVMQSQVK